jgi:hypothetical protein
MKGLLSFRRLTAVGATLGMVGAAVLSTPAPTSAAATTAACAFAGAVANASPGVPLKGGPGGTYSFSGKANCVLNGKVEASTVSSSGTYKSIVCGTGSAAGSATITGSKGDHASGNISITFVAGQGTLTGKISINGAAPITVAGPVSIAPKTGNCVTPVTQFTVSAVIVG